MRRISIDNPKLDNTYITDLSADYVAAAMTSSVRSNNSFAANDLAVFGNPSEELTELKKISSLSGKTGFNLPSALDFAHNKGTPIYKALWDFVSIEANYGLGWVVLTSSPIQWDAKSNKTLYFDGNGTDTTSYRFRFYNSATLTYSEYSPTLTGVGFTKFQMGYLIREARQIAGDDEERIMSTEDLLRAATRAKNLIRAHNSKYWFWKVDGYNSSISIPGVTTSSIYSLASVANLGTIDVIEYRYTSGAQDEKYVMERKADAEFRALTHNLNQPGNDYPRCYRLLPPDANSSKGYFEIPAKLQNSGIGQFYVSHYKEESDYNSVDDLTSLVMPEIFIDYLVSVIYREKGNDTQADKYYAYFTGPENRKKTLAIEELTGIALLDELDRQYKKSQGQPMSVWRFRGQKAISRLYGSRSPRNADYIRENYFDGEE